MGVKEKLARDRKKGDTWRGESNEEETLREREKETELR